MRMLLLSCDSRVSCLGHGTVKYSFITYEDALVELSLEGQLLRARYGPGVRRLNLVLLD